MPTDMAELGERHGDCCKEKAKIRVHLDSENPEEMVEHTFFHELVHALLYATTRPKLSDDEKFVDSLGAALHQYEQTKKGNLRG
jgi:Zn-dependent peptidase ImmA (M78 family)